MRIHWAFLALVLVGAAKPTLDGKRNEADREKVLNGGLLSLLGDTAGPTTATPLLKPTTVTAKPLDSERAEIRRERAKRAFDAVQPLVEAYRNAKVFEKPRTLKADLDRMRGAMAEIHRRLEEVSAIGEPAWGVPAACEQAELVDVFGSKLLGAPIPKGLDEESHELYGPGCGFTGFSFDFEGPAMDGYESCVASAVAFRIENEWVAHARKRLEELKPKPPEPPSTANH